MIHVKSDKKMARKNKLICVACSSDIKEGSSALLMTFIYYLLYISISINEVK